MTGVRQFDEQKVLAQALEVFWRKGLRTTSMLDLAQATGVQRGSLYNAYGGKEVLFLLAFDRYAAGFLEAARKTLASPDPTEALSAFFDAAITNMTSGSPPRGCLTTKTAVDADLIGSHIQERMRMLLDDLEALIREALSREEMRSKLTLQPSDASRVIVTFTRGLAVMECVYHDHWRLKETARALVKILLIQG